MPAEFFAEQAPDSPIDEEQQHSMTGEEGDEKIIKAEGIRKQVVNEILTTERSFVRDLEVMQVRHDLVHVLRLVVEQRN